MLFKKKKLAKHCSVYISDKHEQIIIAPGHVNKAGIIFEQENCKTLSTISFYADKEEIGKRIVKVYESCLTGEL